MSLGTNGRIKKQLVKDLSLKFGSNENITELNIKNIKKNINDILNWAVLREKVKKEILNNKKIYLSQQNTIEHIDNKNETSEGNNMKIVLNQILYGPPGTGKTYNTIDKTLQIIDGIVPDRREEAKERFEVLKDAGQIEFITFHQSYGYEEFVEGIKAVTRNNNIEYNIVNGLFKRFSNKARKLILDTTDEGFFKLLDKKFIDLDVIDVGVYKILGSNSKMKNMIVVLNKKSNKYYYIPYSKLYSLYVAKDIGRNKIFKEISKDLGVAIPLLEKILEISKSNIKTTTNKNYILIIDEINRGNISKIFGELITLIEESKRLGNDEAMEITLPYSGEKFGVPKNLYIIGTMNTADRSIALMDTALRRRFEFEEMMPNACLLYNDKKTYPLEGDDEKEDITKLCNWDMISTNHHLYFHKDYEHDILINTINLRRLLHKINQRIEYLYDRDHTIGHAYFMGVKDKETLDGVMRNKVIPLLQEYFYDDWEKIALVLNDGFIVKETQDTRKLFDSMDDEYIEEDKYIYNIAEDFSVDSYRKIYGKIEQNQVGE